MKIKRQSQSSNSSSKSKKKINHNNSNINKKKKSLCNLCENINSCRQSNKQTKQRKNACYARHYWFMFFFFSSSYEKITKTKSNEKIKTKY